MEPRFFWKRLSWPLQILVWILAFYVAWYVVPMGYGKLADYSSLGFFEQNNLPFWLMLVVGVIEVFGVALMFLPKLSFYGSFPLFLVMLSASYYNGWGTDTLIFAAITLVIAFLTRPGVFRAKPEITTISV